MKEDGNLHVSSARIVDISKSLVKDFDSIVYKQEPKLATAKRVAKKQISTAIQVDLQVEESPVEKKRVSTKKRSPARCSYKQELARIDSDSNQCLL